MKAKRLQKTINHLRDLADFIQGTAPPPELRMRFYARRPRPLGNSSVNSLFPHGPAWTPSPKEIAKDPACGTSACALGHAAWRWPEVAATVDALHPSDAWAALGEALFPALYKKTRVNGTAVTNRHWADVFGVDLSDDRAECAERLRKKARALEKELQKAARTEAEA